MSTQEAPALMNTRPPPFTTPAPSSTDSSNLFTPSSTPPDKITTMLWDYIVVGGGIGGSVVSNRLLGQDASRNILLIEAGPDVSGRTDIVYANTTTALIAGEFDWNITSAPIAKANNRTFHMAQGKCLGGSTAINMGLWTRGPRKYYDLWAETVDDSRWSYDGQLPFFKKTERFWNETLNPDQHGSDGNLVIQSVVSTGRDFPLRDQALDSFEALGYTSLPGLDANAGHVLGIGYYQENKDQGRREIASSVYSLEGVTVLTNTQVARILIDMHDGVQAAVGIQLADGTQIRGHQVILAAGAIHSPQILMLSGVGPAAELRTHRIAVKVDNPDVGRNYRDHFLSSSLWSLRNPTAGLTVGSNNTELAREHYNWGTAADFVVTTSVPREGLAAAIAEDEGLAPGPDHPLLANDQPFFEHVFAYNGVPRGRSVAFSSVAIRTTATGSVTLRSASIEDAPLPNPNFLGTAVDRYVYRQGLRQLIDFAASDKTSIAREVIEAEIVPSPFTEGYSLNSTDAYLDERTRAGIRSVHHSMGTNAMGKVVDTELRVKGVNNLYVVDASVFPVIIPAHLQVAVYALGEQAAEIIGNGKKCNETTIVPYPTANATQAR